MLSGRRVHHFEESAKKYGKKARFTQIHIHETKCLCAFVLNPSSITADYYSRMHYKGFVRAVWNACCHCYYCSADHHISMYWYVQYMWVIAPSAINCVQHSDRWQMKQNQHFWTKYCRICKWRFIRVYLWFSLTHFFFSVPLYLISISNNRI